MDRGNLVRIELLLDTPEVLRETWEEGGRLPQLRSQQGRSLAVAEPVPASDADALRFRRLKPGPGRSAAEVASHQRARIDSAMVEVVAERGYDRTTVREIARVAGISTRAFYAHYAGKEECFLHVHRRLAQEMLRQLGEVDREDDSRGRLRTAVKASVEWWSRDARATRFLLAGPYGAGGAGLKQLRSWERSLGAELARRIGGCEKEEGLAELGVGIATGMVATARARMSNDGWMSPDLWRDLNAWALSYERPPLELEALQMARWGAKDKRGSRRGESNEAGSTAPSACDDLALLHSATFKLAASGDCELLTPRHICAAAGVSRRRFELHFPDVDSCLISAAELHIDLAVARARRACEREQDLARRAFCGIVELCDQVSLSPALAFLCFSDNLNSGEALVRREWLLLKRVAEVCDAPGLEMSRLSRQLSAEASLRAGLGVIRSEVAAGRAGCLHLKAAAIASLILALTVGPASIVDAMAEGSKIENIAPKNLRQSMTLGDTAPSAMQRALHLLPVDDRNQ